MEAIESFVNIRDRLIYLLSLHLGSLIMIESLPLRFGFCLIVYIILTMLYLHDSVIYVPSRKYESNLSTILLEFLS